MNIQLTNAGKRFNRDWIFRRLNYTFQQGISYAITGPNGSGKSTLLQTIAGAIAPSEGIVEYRIRNKELGIRNWELGISEGNKEQGTRNKGLGIKNENKPVTGNWKPVTGNWKLATE